MPLSPEDLLSVVPAPLLVVVVVPEPTFLLLESTPTLLLSVDVLCVATPSLDLVTPCPVADAFLLGSFSVFEPASVVRLSLSAEAPVDPALLLYLGSPL